MLDRQESGIAEILDGVSALSMRVGLGIIDFIQSHGLQSGAHLPANRLAKELNVSRFPVREALLLLEQFGIVKSRTNRGFFLASNDEDLESIRSVLKQPDEEHYFRIAEDRLARKLPEQFTETDIMRTYDMTRPQVQSILLRMTREGWVERRPGYGWSFLPILSSSRAHSQSYRFRMAIEPAALLEPTFRIDRKAFAYWHDVQMELLEETDHVTPAQVFEIGSRFHEMLMRCSHNPFFVESLRRHNRLRRLLEYRVSINPERLKAQCHEHLELLERLTDGDRIGASILLQRHLDVVRVAKSLSLKTDRDEESKPAAPPFHF